MSVWRQCLCHTRTPPYTHIHPPTHIHTHIHTYARTHTHTHTHAHTHARTRTHTHAYTHARTHARARAHTHTHTHTNKTNIHLSFLCVSKINYKHVRNVFSDGRSSWHTETAAGETAAGKTPCRDLWRTTRPLGALRDVLVHDVNHFSITSKPLFQKST